MTNPLFQCIAIKELDLCFLSKLLSLSRELSAGDYVASICTQSGYGPIQFANHGDAHLLFPPMFALNQESLAIFHQP